MFYLCKRYFLATPVTSFHFQPLYLLCGLLLFLKFAFLLLVLIVEMFLGILSPPVLHFKFLFSKSSSSNSLFCSFHFLVPLFFLGTLFIVFSVKGFLLSEPMGLPVKRFQMICILFLGIIKL
jgi:hypothetical protein